MGTAAEIIKVAKAEVGYHEGQSNGRWNNHQKYSPAVPGLEWSQDQAWCATYVAWCALQAGAADLYPRTASCAMGVRWFKDRDRFSEYPAVGAQVFFGSGGGAHTGIVCRYDATYIYTVEGNTNADGSAEGDGVYLKKRRRRDPYVYGYGYPVFAEGIKSADPAWQDEAPKPPTETPKPAPTPSTVSGIDVSSYQSETYSLTGVDFVIVKATEGTHYVNPKHAAQVRRARDAGRVVGHYHFLRPGSMKPQVDYFLKHAKPAAGEVLALDWEDAGVSCAAKDEALKYLKSKAGGRKIVLYCNTVFWLTKDTTSYAADGLWIAHYNGKPGAPGIRADWLIHQYTDKPVDTNVTHWPTRDAMKAWASSAEAAKPDPKAKPKPVVDLSHVVAAARRDPGLPQGGRTHPSGVKLVEKALQAEGLLSAQYAADGSFGSLTVRAYAKWQVRYSKLKGLSWTGADVNGIPGLTSLKALGDRHGFEVKA